MSSIFRLGDDGYYANADPDSDLDYGITCWIEDQTFTSAAWSISPTGSPGPTLHDSEINAVAITIDETEYAAGKVASIWVSGPIAGITYTVTLDAQFSGGGRDSRSFQLICADQ